MEAKHTPGPWSVSGPMGTDHLKGFEPWFWVMADRTLHLQVKACSDGYVRGENEANARLIAAAPDLLEALLDCRRALELANFTGELAVVDAAIAKALPLNALADRPARETQE